MNLVDKLKSISTPAIPTINNGKDDTVADFWKNFIAPLLPDKNTVIGIYNMLLRYLDDPDAVFVVRNYSQPEGGKKNYITLRRGFYTETDDYKYFFTDNFFAAYFCKLAIDGFVPVYDEFKEAMVSRSFPARFGPFDKNYERPKAAYSIDGSNGKDPGFGKAGYKISHVIDSGMGYFINGKSMRITQWSNLYGFSRGDYNDYQLKNDKYGNYYVRTGVPSVPAAKEVLKAQFLRLACPLNYILTPKAGVKRCHSFAPGVCVAKNDVGEMPELRQYAVEQLKKIYGPIYDDYLDRLMLAPQPKISNPGDTYIGISYGLGVGNGSTSLSQVKTIPTAKRKSSAFRSVGPGQYAKNIFVSLLTSGKLSSKQIDDLRNKKYCSNNFGISYPVIEIIGTDTYEPGRYYKEAVDGKYVICSQWYDRNKDRIDEWISKNGF